MKKKIIWLVVSCLIVAALLMASCAPAEEEEEVVTPEEEEEEAIIEEEVAPAPEEPKYGGMLIFPNATDFSWLDEVYGLAYDCRMLHLMGEELFTGDWAKGPAGTDEVGWDFTAMMPQFERPCLAESWEKPDDQTLVFHIRKGVHWWNKPPVNGRELVADDVVYSINRIFGESRTYVYQVHKGVAPESVTAPDKYTVVVKCPPGEIGPLHRDICDCLTIVPHEVIEEYGDMRDWRNACFTGPFMITDYVPMSSSTFVRNPNYWGTDPAHPENQLPYLDSVKILVIQDNSTRIAAMRTGKVDQIGVGWEEVSELKRTNPELKWARYLNTIPYHIFMRTDTTPFDDIRVRHALALAINNQEIAEEYYGGNAEVLCQMVGPVKGWLDVYVPLEELPQSTRELYQYHPDKARQLLAEAGYPDGFETEILCHSGSEDFLSIIKAYWADIGVDLRIDSREYAVYNAIWVSGRHKAMVWRYWNITTPYKYNPIRPGPAANMSIIDDPYINEQYTKIQENWFNEDVKRPILRESLLYVLEQSWMIQPPAAYGFGAWQPWLKGYHGELCVGYHNHGNWPIWVWLDLDLKEAMTGKR